LKVTAVAPVKFVPLIVTLVPTDPVVGVKLPIVGEATFKNALRMFAVACWIRASTRPVAKGPGTLSSAQLQDLVPDAKTHAPLGAW
jgi:hypothetical protein